MPLVKKCDPWLEEAYEKILGELGLPNVGAACSRREREVTKKLSDNNLTYGEFGFPSLEYALTKIRDEFGLPQVGASGAAGRLQVAGEGVFYDLGSGLGKAVIAACAVHPFRKAVGVETLEGLHVLSVELGKQYEELAASLRGRGDERPLALVEFERGNLFDANIADADVVLAHCAAFDEDLMSDLTAFLGRHLKRGAFVITVSLLLADKRFKPVDHSAQSLDGLPGIVHISQKIT